MIPRMDSQSLNQILTDAQNKLLAVSTEARRTREDILKKIIVAEKQQEYNNKLLQYINEVGVEYKPNKSIFYLNRPVNSQYNRYGVTIVPRTTSSVDLFNINVLLEEDDNVVEKTYFRNLASVDYSGDAFISGQSILIDPRSEEKSVFFDENPPDEVSITLTVKGEQYFNLEEYNAITIDPYLPGTLDLLSVIIFEHSEDQEGTALEGEDCLVKNLPKGKILLERNYRFYKAVFNFRINKEVSSVFGIKKIGLLREIRQNSFVIAKIEYPQLIRDVKEDIIIYDLYGENRLRITPGDPNGPQLFANYVDNFLIDEIYPTKTGENRRLSLGTQIFYLRIPLSNTDSIIGVELTQVLT